MTPLQEQFELLKNQFPRASLRDLPSGAAIVVLPEVGLPPGWSRPNSTIRFLVPVGYPFAKPDCFWADPDLRLQSGQMPQNTQFQPMPETAEQLLWFSWHTAHWHPSRDTLVSYLYVIKTRLGDPK